MLAAACETTTVNVIGPPPASPLVLDGVSVTRSSGVTTVTAGALVVAEPAETVNVAEFVRAVPLWFPAVLSTTAV